MSSSAEVTESECTALVVRERELYEEQTAAVYSARDQLFGWLFLGQWLFAVGIAVFWSPFGWEGRVRTTHAHVPVALALGGLIAVPAFLMTRFHRGNALTRHTVAGAQMLFSGLFIHLSGGRIETHFHVFGSLAFLAFYRDARILLTAALVVSFEHLVRALFWAESVYGVVNPEWWRFFEHAFWVVFETSVLLMGIHESHREMRELARHQAELEAAGASVENQVRQRTLELEANREQYRALVETAKAVPWEFDPLAQRFTYVGPQFEALLGIPATACLVPGFLEMCLHPDDKIRVLDAFAEVVEHSSGELEARVRHANGSYIWLKFIASSTTGDAAGDATGEASFRPEIVVRGVMFDVTEARRLELELRQAQKLESVGRLASGVAHEINTPVQFVGDSVHFVRDAMNDILNVVAKYQALQAAVLAGQPSRDAAESARDAENDADLSYLLENVPKALERSLEGLERVTGIVRSMKEFAHPDRKEMTAVDLNQAIKSTLTIARTEYKYVADVELELGDIPRVFCHGGDVNQAVLNLVVNAAHAIGDVVAGTEQRGRIGVKTTREGETVVIAVSDTGGGIPLEVRERIFEPFFTTKEVGKGTGQGLAIARSVIADKHGGELSFESELGKGTTFFVRLPIAGKPGEARRAA
jgi:signal transduction histidine kinase